MSDLPVVHANKLSEVYADGSAQIPRYKGLLTKFNERYGTGSPDILLRSPGRVNLIGDHIDYCFFSVLPMAVTADMVMACAVTEEPVIEVANTNEKDFPSAKFEINKDGTPIEIDATKSDWINYFKCGLVVGQDYLKKQGHPSFAKGMKILIDGNVPTGSGLSSSAAFVVCATLTTLLANGYKDISKKLLTKLSITCEQHVGVNSGGMDQAASIFGLKEQSLLVSFLPDLQVTPFEFPKTEPKLNFIVANSLVTANKYETGPVNYNLRVVEVTLGALLMAKKLGLQIKPDGNLNAGTFRGVLDAYFADSKTPYGEDVNDSREKLTKMLQLVEECFTNKEGYTTEQVAQELGVTADELKTKYMTTYPVRYDVLKLHQRATHVFAESKRVLDFLALLQSPPTSSDELFKGLGGLMNKAHDSAANLFNNSCPELDQICDIARANGAAGSRVTGAGWGGSSVHLVPSTKSDAVIKALTEEYYKKRFPNITQSEIDDALLVSEPGSGTVVIDNISLD